MTQLPAIARRSQHKLNSLESKDPSQSANKYARVVQYLNEIQDQASPSRRATARFNLIFIIITAIVSFVVIALASW